MRIVEVDPATGRRFPREMTNEEYREYLASIEPSSTSTEKLINVPSSDDGSWYAHRDTGVGCGWMPDDFFILTPSDVQCIKGRKAWLTQGRRT